MADETRIDPEGLTRLFTTVEEIGADLGVSAKGVRVIRTTIPEPWGDDEHGKRFALRNETNAVDTLDGVDEQVSFLKTFGTEGRAEVRKFQATDDANGEGLAP